MISTRFFVLALLVFCLLSPVTQSGQTVTSSQGSLEPATITMYLTGPRRLALKTFVDGVMVEELATNHQVSFKVAPGYHEISFKFSSLTPIRAIHADSGQELYFWGQYDIPSIGKMFTGVSQSDFHATLTQVHSVEDLTTKDDVLPDAKLAGILASANPTGMDQSQAPTVPAAEIHNLTDIEVQQAIFQGMHDATGSSIGYTLNDTQTNLLSGMVVAGGVSGYSITVFTASTWIEKQAAEAHWLMKTYTESDVDVTMRQDLILVVATPSTPGRLDAQGIAAGSSASHVVLSDETKKIVIEPVREEMAGMSVESALRSIQYGSVVAAFSPQQATRVKDKNGEFLIAVTGGYRKFFKVKKNTPLWSFLMKQGQ